MKKEFSILESLLLKTLSVFFIFLFFCLFILCFFLLFIIEQPPWPGAKTKFWVLFVLITSPWVRVAWCSAIFFQTGKKFLGFMSLLSLGILGAAVWGALP